MIHVIKRRSISSGKNSRGGGQRIVISKETVRTEMAQCKQLAGSWAVRSAGGGCTPYKNRKRSCSSHTDGVVAIWVEAIWVVATIDFAFGTRTVQINHPDDLIIGYLEGQVWCWNKYCPQQVYEEAQPACGTLRGWARRPPWAARPM